MFQVAPHVKHMRGDLKHHEIFANVCKTKIYSGRVLGANLGQA